MFEKKRSINLINDEQAIDLCNRLEDDFFDLKSKRAKYQLKSKHVFITKTL